MVLTNTKSGVILSRIGTTPIWLQFGKCWREIGSLESLNKIGVASAFLFGLTQWLRGGLDYVNCNVAIALLGDIIATEPRQKGSAKEV